MRLLRTTPPWRTAMANALMQPPGAAVVTGVSQAGLGALAPNPSMPRTGLGALADIPAPLAVTLTPVHMPVGSQLVTFEPLSWETTRVLAAPGVYIPSKEVLAPTVGGFETNMFPVADRWGRTRWFAAGYVGECEDPSDRHRRGKHHREADFEEFGATVVFFSMQPSEHARKLIERALIARLDPPIHKWPVG